MREIIVDNFAGGGGASTGIEGATGRSVDIAINHDPDAIAMHKANHPTSKHYCESVWDVDPIEACDGRPVGLAWFSPDCKHFSKAKGGKPKDKNIRGLAWVAVKWAKTVRPRVIMLENVEEFKTWGPLIKGEDGEWYADPSKKGETFNLFVKQLQKLGYEVSWRELKACDYGAPTTRKRFFLIARCDGSPIIWPEPSHGNPESLEVRMGLMKPWRTAAEIIDWSIPCKSIFGREKPLSENTLKRIARGLQKFVIESPNPFIVRIGQTGFGKDGLQNSIDDPLTTIVSKAEHCLVTPTLIQYHSETSEKSVRGQSMDKPIMTVDSSPRYGLVSAFISKRYAGESRSVASSLNDSVHTITARLGQSLVVTALEKDVKATDEKLQSSFITQNYGGGYTGAGSQQLNPLPTITAKDHNSLVNVSLEKASDVSEEVEEFFNKYYGKPVFGDRAAKETVMASHVIQMNNNMDGTDIQHPVNTVVAGPVKLGVVNSFMVKYYGQGTGQDIERPLDTITSKDRFGLVTIKGEEYRIVDIGLRMLEPHELFAAQGFPEDYIIDRDFTGKSYPKSKQVARCGNAVPPPFATALVRANLPEMCERVEEIA